MYLKRIEVQGFKSFADKIGIDFKSGITGVVGPNGSGKSNISDSIRWVLGEQSVKSLRGSKMEDVIFAGTSKRKPLGFAEVTLVLDNKDDKLPIDYSEVCITRRVFRSGESEYYINKTSCRLKDIRELFMDTGVGKDGYSIIGQGKIDEILSTKSGDRRSIFEEAAGIVKFKTRKEEAEKKLEKTQENLIRIKDIINELNLQIEPLRIQAKNAENYLKFKERLKKVEVNLYVREIERLREQISLITKQKELIIKQLTFNEDKRDLLEGKYNRVKTEIEKMDNNIEKIQNSKYDTQSQTEKINSELRLGNEKINMIEREITKLDIELKELDKKVLEIADKKKEIVTRNEKILDEIETLKEKLEEKNNLFNDISQAMVEREENIDKYKGDIIEYFNQMADKKSEINSIDVFNRNIENRIKQINNEIEELEKNKSENNTKIEEMTEKIGLTKKKLRDLQEERQNTNIRKGKKEKEYNEMVIEFNQTKEKIQAKLSKYNLLKDMKNEYEGFYKSVKNALIAVKNNKDLGQGTRGVVADLILVDEKYEKAIEIALGSSLQNIVTDTEKEAKGIINYLKKNKLGRVTFLPINTLKEKRLNTVEKQSLETVGCLGLASDIIRYDKEFNSVFNYLLGRVIIVDNIDNGIKIARLIRHSMRIVALDGDVINAGGSITGGSYNTKNTNILGRKRQIEELEIEIGKLKDKHKYLESKLNEAKKEFINLAKDLSGLENETNELKITLMNIENKKSQFEYENEKSQNMIIKYDREKIQLVTENESSNNRVEELKNELHKIQMKNNSVKEIISNTEENFGVEKIKRENLQKEVTEIKVKLASYQQEHKSVIENVSKLDEEKIYAIDELNQKKKVCNQDKDDIEKLKIELSSFKQQKRELDAVLLEQEIKLKEIKGDKNNYLQTFHLEQEKLKEMNKKISDLQKSTNTLEIKDTKYNTQLDNIVNKLWDEYELSYKMALNYKVEIENVTKIQSEIKEIKNQIRLIGNVNVDAIEEYDKVKERYEFLKEQEEDLSGAKNSLNKVIGDMKKQMSEQFVEQFQIIRKHFNEVFMKLFGGGKSDVYLENKEDPLNSGIEIIAQPPGKKLQKLSLLSGGERALTAIALLFGILQTKPTPFCILDEIEAALDDANVYRFANYLKELSDETQFIVITHRKGTMESVDTLYGVTMEEEGVTKLVSVKLSEKVS